MELEQYIEEDVKAFLDRVVVERRSAAPAAAPSERKDGVLTPEELTAYAPGRDYPSDLEAALKEKDILKAKRILADLKAEFDSYPQNAPERAERKTLLEALYRRFQEAVSASPQLQEEEIITGVRAMRPAAPERPRSGPVPQPAEKSPPRQKMTEDEERALIADIAKAETLADDGKPGEAMRAYHRVRSRLSPEAMTPEQRARVLKRMQSAYGRISDAATAKQPPRPAPPASNAARRFEEHASAAKSATDAGDLAEAMRQFRAMREIIAVLPAERQGQAREALLATHDLLEQRISTTEPGTVLEHEERRLTGKP